MGARKFVSLLVFLFCFALAERVSAAELIVQDACSRQLEGSISDPNPSQVVLSVDQDGNVAITTVANGNYVGGLGQCEALADKPICVLSASHTKIERGGQVTLYAKCTKPTDSIAWNAPAGSPTLVDTDPVSIYSKSVTLPNKGAFTYTVKGTSTSGTGSASNAVTILVGNAAGTPDKPACTLSLSPNPIQTTQSATATVVCQPEAASYTWDAAETNAPASPSSATGQANLTFATAGTYTYKVLGVNATGNGPKASATITVEAGSGGGPLAYRASAARGAAGTFNYPTGTQPGDWLVLWIFSTVDIPTPAGWANPQKLNWFSNSRWANVFRRQAGAETSVSIPSAGSMILTAYSGGSGWGNITAITESTNTASTCSTSIARTNAQSVIYTAFSDRGGGTAGAPGSFGHVTNYSATSSADRVYGVTGTSSVVWTQAENTLPGVCVSLEILP